MTKSFENQFYSGQLEPGEPHPAHRVAAAPGGAELHRHQGDPGTRPGEGAPRKKVDHLARPPALCAVGTRPQEFRVPEILPLVPSTQALERSWVDSRKEPVQDASHLGRFILEEMRQEGTKTMEGTAGHGGDEQFVFPVLLIRSFMHREVRGRRSRRRVSFGQAVSF